MLRQKVQKLESDVDIPQTRDVNNNTFAVIIANENYSDAENVPYAINDGTAFNMYCSTALGIPSSNIKFIMNATLNNIRRQVKWLTQSKMLFDGVLSSYTLPPKCEKNRKYKGCLPVCQ